MLHYIIAGMRDFVKVYTVMNAPQAVFSRKSDENMKRFLPFSLTNPGKCCIIWVIHPKEIFMFTKDTLFAQLNAMNAPRDSVVLVHSSLKAIGDVENRGQGVLDALIEWFTADGGLLCIPTHTWAFLDNLDEPTLDVNSDRVCIGTLPKLAAGDPRAHRSLHPTHSMAVFGDNDAAEAFIAGEFTVDTSTHPRSCYGKLVDRKGYVLLLGVGHNRNTTLHSVEEMMDVPNRLSVDLKPTKIRLKSGDIIERPIHCHHAVGIKDVSAHYPKYEPAFRHHGAITDGEFGSAHAQLCSTEKMAAVMRLIRERSAGAELMADDAPLAEELYL